MKKLGPPDRGFGNIRPLTTDEKRVTGLGSRWCVGRDSGGTLKFYEKVPGQSGYDYGYGPLNEWSRWRALNEFWDE
jgi:hypothetical protein